MEELYESKNPLVRFVHNKRLSVMVNLVPKGAGLRILDAGCGEGQLVERIHQRSPEHQYEGLDITPVALESAQKRCPYAKFSAGDMCAMPYADASFDVVLCSEVLEHIHEYQKAISECERILKPGGLFIASFPHEVLYIFCRFLLGRRPIKIPDHVNAFTPRTFRQQTQLSCIKQKQVPFPLPFFLSLVCVQVFQKPS
jgi:ubiquinone/menaquinone biosynthesis C-methylase UbiE